MDRKALYPNNWGVSQHYPGPTAPQTQNTPASQQQFATGPYDHPHCQYAGFQSRSVVASDCRSSVAPALRLDHWRGSSLPGDMQPLVCESPELINDSKSQSGPADKNGQLYRQLVEAKNSLSQTKTQLAQSEKNVRDLAAWALQERERLTKRQQELESMLERFHIDQSQDGRHPAADMGYHHEQPPQDNTRTGDQLGRPQFEQPSAANMRFYYERPIQWIQQETNRSEGQPGLSQSERPLAANTGPCHGGLMQSAQQELNGAGDQIRLSQLEGLPGNDKTNSDTLHVAHSGRSYGAHRSRTRIDKKTRKNERKRARWNRLLNNLTNADRNEDSAIKSEHDETPWTGTDTYNQCNNGHVPTRPATVSHYPIVNGVNQSNMGYARTGQAVDSHYPNGNEVDQFLIAPLIPPTHRLKY